VHIARFEDLDRVAVSNPAALKLARAFWPGPLTLVLPKKAVVPDAVTSGRNSVAVRMPAHPAFLRLLRLAGTPLAAPSANPFGYVSPTTARHVQDGLGERIGHILDGGACRIGIESTIVDLRDSSRPRILRPGAITADELQRILKRPVSLQPMRTQRSATAQIAPGQLARHYSPATPVRLHPKIRTTLIAATDQTSDGTARQRVGPAAGKEAWVFLKRPPQTVLRACGDGPVRWLDRVGDLRGAARRLFAVLRELDGLGLSAIHVEIPAGAGLAEAIRDRLARASGRP